jgi:hypothetical protein
MWRILPIQPAPALFDKRVFGVGAIGQEDTRKVRPYCDRPADFHTSLRPSLRLARQLLSGPLFGFQVNSLRHIATCP